MDSEKQAIMQKQDLYKKSNFLISAKYESSLIENKIIAYSLSKALDFKEDPNSKILYSEIKASELKSILNGNEGSFYSQLKNIAPILTGRVIGMTNSSERTFEFISIISHAKYENSVLMIGWNPLLKNYLSNLENNFTLLNLDLMMSFKSIWSFRLYELLRSKCYPKYYNWDKEYFEINYNLSELKFEIGVADAGDDDVRKILDNKQLSEEDFDLALKKAEQKSAAKYKHWNDFKKKVLDPSVSEINELELSDIDVSYDLIKSGYGGEVRNICFKIRLKKQNLCDKKEIPDTASIDNAMDELRDYLSSEFKSSDIRLFLKQADNNVQAVKDAYDIYKMSSNVKNPIGFIIDAIAGKYKADKQPDTNNRPKKKSNSFAFCQSSSSYTEDSLAKLESTIWAN